MKLEKYIDHTNLKQDATKGDIEKLCKEAKEHDFASVCVNPCWVSFCKSLLEKTSVKVCTVIGFPLGATDTETKAFEAKKAVQNGASEVDMVINVGYAKNGDWEKVENDIKSVVKSAKEENENTIVKVILETCLLTNEQIEKACYCAQNAKSDFVKTSTGFSTAGATVQNVTLMKNTVGNSMKVKAAGGIRDKATALSMIEAGADRIGTSNGIAIVTL